MKNVPPEIQFFADTFTDMQPKRELADYDPEYILPA